jgi:MFS family permease
MPGAVTTCRIDPGGRVGPYWVIMGASRPSIPHRSTPVRPVGRLALTALVAESTAVQALASLAMLAMPAVAPAIAKALGLPAALIGAQIAIGYGAAMLTSLVAGTLVRRMGAVRTTQASLLLTTVGALAITLGTLSALAAGSLLIGFAYGMVNPAASHLLVQATTAANRNLVFSLKQTGVPLGGVAAGMMAPPIAQAWGWQWAMAAVAIIGALLVAVLQVGRARWDGDRDPQARLGGNPFAGLIGLWRMPAVRAVSLAGFVFAAVQLSLSTFLVTMLVTDVGWPLVQAGLVLSTVQVAGALGRVLWGALADRWNGMATLMVVGAVMVAAALITGALGPSWPPAVIFAVLAAFGASAIGWNGVYLAQVARATPVKQVSRVTGLSLFVTYGGVLVGPPAFAAAQHLTGSWTATYALSALPAAAGIALLARARRRGL